MVLHIHKQATRTNTEYYIYSHLPNFHGVALSVHTGVTPAHEEWRSSTWQQILELMVLKSYFATGLRCHSAGEVGVHRCNVLVEGGVLGVPGAGQPQLLRGVGELEGGVGVGRVREQGALPLQQVPHPLQKLPEPEGQGGLPQAVQLLEDRQNIYIKTKQRKTSLNAFLKASLAWWVVRTFTL